MGTSIDHHIFLSIGNKIQVAINNLRNKLYRKGRMAYYQHDMLSIKSRTVLANILAEVVLLSEAIQQYREALARIPYFDCIALFRFLDREEKGYLREKDFQRVVGTSHRKLLTYAFSWFDNMKVGEITRLEFAVFLLPKEDLSLREVVAERVQNPQISYAQHETILEQFEIFRRLLLQIMNREMRIVELRRQLVNNEEYSPRGALVAIDGNDHRWVCSQDLLKFLKNYGFDVGLRQVEKLMEAINYSLDGKISQQQLAWVMEGFETKNKTYLAKIKASNKKEEQPPSKLEEKSKSSPSRQKDTSSNLRQQLQLLTEKMRLAEEEEKQIDEELIKCDIISIQENKKLYQLKMHEINRQKQEQLKLAQQAQRQQVLMQEYRKHQRHEQMLREAELLRQKQRLINIQKRLQMGYIETTPKLKAASPQFSSKRLYSFAEESPNNPIGKEFQIIDAHLPRRDYQNLTNLNSLSIVQSYRRASEVSDTHYQLGESTAYFNSEQLKQRIKQEMEAEKAIQEKFNRGDYNTSRFTKPIPSASQNTNRKTEETPKYGPNAFESPQRVPNFKKSAANKFTVSTGNKLSGQKQ